MVHTASLLGWDLTVQPDCVYGRVVCGTVYGDMHYKDHLGSITRVGFLPSATWPKMLKKHSINGLINQMFGGYLLIDCIVMLLTDADSARLLAVYGDQHHVRGHGVHSGTSAAKLQ